MYLVTIQIKSNPQAQPAQTIVKSQDIVEFIQQNLTEETVVVIQDIPLFNLNND